MADGESGNLDGGGALSFTEKDAAEFFDRGVAALGRADLPEAKAALQRCVELAPGSAEAWCYLGMTCSSKEPAAAAAALDRALALDPNHLGALYWRAEVHWVDGDARAAAGLLRRYNDLVPDVSPNLARLGFAHLAAGDVEAGNAVLREAVDAGGGLASVGVRHTELRRAIYLEVLGRRDEAEQLIRTVNGAGLLPAYPATRYPRDLEDQRCALENVVAGRDIVVLGSGPSLAQLQPLLAELGPGGCENLCFFGFNNIPVAERMLQETVGRGVDLACMTSAAVMELHAAWVADFFGRTSPGLFLTLANALPSGRATADMIVARPDKLFYFSAEGDYPPIPEDPLNLPPINALMCSLPLAVLGQPRQIFLFGCDGAAPRAIDSGAPVYFRQGSAEYGAQSIPNTHYAKWLARDTFFFNALVPTVLDCLSVLHGVPVPPIHICNPDSAYRPFPRISAREFLRLYATAAGADRLFPARIAQMQRRVDGLLAQLRRNERPAAEKAAGPEVLARFAAPLRALRRAIRRMNSS
jgi:hypothetical protein